MHTRKKPGSQEDKHIKKESSTKRNIEFIETTGWFTKRCIKKSTELTMGHDDALKTESRTWMRTGTDNLIPAELFSF